MPQIKVQYSGSSKLAELGPGHLERFGNRLSAACATLFQVPEHPLDAASFSIYFEKVEAPSHQTQDVIIRVYLHHFPLRLVRSEEKAQFLVDLVPDLLEGLMGLHFTGMTVGVSLSFMEIAWTSAEIKESATV